MQEAIPVPYNNHMVGGVKRGTYKMHLSNSQSTLKPRNTIVLLHI